MSVNGQDGSGGRGELEDRETSSDRSDESYEPGDTLHRGMTLACGLVLLFFALISCGFVASVLSQRH